MTLDEWLAAVAAELGIPAPDNAEVHAVLDLARDAAHGVARPAAPLTTFLVGIAVGRGAALAAASQSVTALLQG
jgi:Domain of unknown function (DUF6457)